MYQEARYSYHKSPEIERKIKNKKADGTLDRISTASPDHLAYSNWIRIMMCKVRNVDKYVRFLGGATTDFLLWAS